MTVCMLYVPASECDSKQTLCCAQLRLADVDSDEINMREHVSRANSAYNNGYVVSIWTPQPYVECIGNIGINAIWSVIKTIIGSRYIVSVGRQIKLICSTWWWLANTCGSIIKSANNFGIGEKISNIFLVWFWFFHNICVSVLLLHTSLATTIWYYTIHSMLNSYK